MNKAIPSLFLAGFLLLSLPGISHAEGGAAPEAPAQKQIRVGVGAFALPEQRDEFDAATLTTLFDTFGIENVTVTDYTVADLEKAVKAGEVDVFVSSSGAARRFAPMGARPLATSVAPGLRDPNHNEGTAIILRKGDSRTLAELEGARLSANMAWGFSGYQIAMGEVAALGRNPDKFFGRTQFFNRSDSMESVARSVASGTTDVGFLRLCAFEELSRKYPDVTGKLRVLAPPKGVDTSAVSCVASTRLYPAHSLSVMPTVTPELSRKLLVALLTMPATESGREWSVATDFHAVDKLLEDLRIGPYAYLRDWTMSRFVNAFWPYLLLLLLAVAGLAYHGWRLRVLVARRERELEEVHVREVEQSQRIAMLQRAGAVGQLSSLIAHEVHQPLSAIRLFAEGLERRARAGTATNESVLKIAGRIAGQAERAGAIVDRVRDYAHQREPVFQRIRVADLVQHIRETYPKLEAKTEVIISREARHSEVRGSVLELELAVVNLIRNAVEAVRGVESPRVVLEVSCVGNKVRFEVSDNGPKLSEEKIRALASPISSEKPEGLGLGLSIVKHLVERHQGELVFHSGGGAAGDGLAADIILPTASPDAGNEKETTKEEMEKENRA